MFTRFLLAAEEGLSMAERSEIAITVTFQGIISVFGALALLWGFIELMHYLFARGKKERASKKATVVEVVPAPAQSAQAPVTFGMPDDGALVAAITAAISAAMAEDGYTGGFRVVSFKRVGSAQARRKF